MTGSDPAFPAPLNYAASGMTLRDYFAAQALSGMHARDSYDEGLATPEKRAALAYVEADAMLKAREGR